VDHNTQSPGCSGTRPQPPVRALFLKTRAWSFLLPSPRSRQANCRTAGLPREVTRAYHNRKRHEIRLAARALVADVDGDPGDGCQRGFLSSRSTSALVKPMSSSRWSSSSASTRWCMERDRLEVIMRLPIVSFLVIWCWLSYLASVSCECLTRSIWYRLYRTADALALMHCGSLLQSEANPGPLGWCAPGGDHDSRIALAEGTRPPIRTCPPIFRAGWCDAHGWRSSRGAGLKKAGRPSAWASLPFSQRGESFPVRTIRAMDGGPHPLNR